jgi:hypothetical protein
MVYNFKLESYNDYSNPIYLEYSNFLCIFLLPSHFSVSKNGDNCMKLTINCCSNSVRVSNELGAGNFRAAKFAVIVVSITSIAIGVVCMIVVFATRDYFPYLFTTSEAVAVETTKLAVLLGITVLLNSLQPVLSGKYKEQTILQPDKHKHKHKHNFIPCWFRCGCWSRMASHCRIYQHRVLLRCWIACWHTPRIHIWFWC